MSKINLLTIGDVAIDQFMEIENATLGVDGDNKLLQLIYGSKIPVDTFRATIAGNSCNVAIACAKLGLNSAVFTIVGNDPNGDKFAQSFERIGINGELRKIDPTFPTSIHVIISFDSERTILSHHPKRNYKIEDLEEFVAKNDMPDWLYYTSMPPNFNEFQKELIKFVEKNHKTGVCFNPGSFHLKAGPSAVKEFLEVTDVVFLNLEEAQFITSLDTEETLELHQELRKLGPKISVITNSVKGSSAYDGENLVKMGVYLHDTEIVDKTGAGDAFAGAFVAALHNNKSIKEALTWGSINSARVITKIGSIHGHTTLEEMQEIERIVKSRPSFSTPTIL